MIRDLPLTSRSRQCADLQQIEGKPDVYASAPVAGRSIQDTIQDIILKEHGDAVPVPWHGPIYRSEPSLGSISCVVRARVSSVVFALRAKAWLLDRCRALRLS